MERRGGDHLPAGAFGQRLNAVDLKAELKLLVLLNSISVIVKPI
jgi:hypothetical protein